MVIDTSAILAILLDEREAGELEEKLRRPSDPLHIPAPILLEAMVVLSSRLGAVAHNLLQRLLLDTGASVVPFSHRQAGIAWDCYERFGKGRHKARLNFGDCMAYACATDLGEPLLYVGEDFAMTDIAKA